MQMWMYRKWTNVVAKGRQIQNMRKIASRKCNASVISILYKIKFQTTTNLLAVQTHYVLVVARTWFIKATIYYCSYLNKQKSTEEKCR